MIDLKNYESCVFSWENLVTIDVDVAKRFYQGLFGWDATSLSDSQNLTHFHFSLGGHPICSVSKIDKIQGEYFPPQWVPYISVRDTEERIADVQNMGGTLLTPIFPTVDFEAAALMKDPTGAIFAIRRPETTIERYGSKISGMACFHELITTNLDQAGMFYSQVFHWNPRAENFGDITYIMFNSGNVNVGSMMGVPNQDVLPRWITYWRVQDCDKSLKKALALGGGIFNSVEIIKRTGRYVLLVDPIGAVFGIMQPEH